MKKTSFGLHHIFIVILVSYASAEKSSIYNESPGLKEIAEMAVQSANRGRR
jgi:hypothetical protein